MLLSTFAYAESPSISSSKMHPRRLVATLVPVVSLISAPDGTSTLQVHVSIARTMVTTEKSSNSRKPHFNMLKPRKVNGCTWKWQNLWASETEKLALQRFSMAFNGGCGFGCLDIWFVKPQT